jgi:hypothetical protein
MFRRVKHWTLKKKKKDQSVKWYSSRALKHVLSVPVFVTVISLDKWPSVSVTVIWLTVNSLLFLSLRCRFHFRVDYKESACEERFIAVTL